MAEFHCQVRQSGSCGRLLMGVHPTDPHHWPGERLHCGSRMPWQGLASQQPQSQLAEQDHSITSGLAQMLSGEVIKVTVLLSYFQNLLTQAT